MIREAVRGDLEGLMALYAQLHNEPAEQPGEAARQRIGDGMSGVCARHCPSKKLLQAYVDNRLQTGEHAVLL